MAKKTILFCNRPKKFCATSKNIYKSKKIFAKSQKIFGKVEKILNKSKKIWAEISFLKNPAEIYFWLCRFSKNRGQKTFRPRRQKGSKIKKKGQNLPRGLDAMLELKNHSKPCMNVCKETLWRADSQRQREAWFPMNKAPNQAILRLRKGALRSVHSNHRLIKPQLASAVY